MSHGLPFLYLIGVPGAGKTTALKAALEGSTAHQQREPVPHLLHLWDRRPGSSPMIFEIGVRREGLFSGTDGLGYSVMPQVVRWLQAAQPGPLIAEGDRLATTAFFEAVRAAGYDLSIVWLDVPPETAAARREQRGSQQSETWLRGRATKVQNLVRTWEPLVTRIDGRETVHGVAGQLRQQRAFEGV